MTLSKQEGIVVWVAFTVPSGDELPMAFTRDRLLCGRVEELAEGGVRYVQVGGGVWEGVSS